MAQNHRAIYFLVLLITFGVGSSSASHHLTQTRQASQDVMSVGAGLYGLPGAIRGSRFEPYVSGYEYGPYGAYGPYGPYGPPGVYRGGWTGPYGPPEVYVEPEYGLIPGLGRAPCMYLPGAGACVPIGGGKVYGHSAARPQQTPPHKAFPQPEVHA